ncbi:MAG: hypothetical protein ACD_80C00098G0006 [uncultured bacterium (gcode 4)]|uniref:Uncharacterized protein n=1 Tax=uncultured bacterium (gcode 4) TaxID=1234023 RepID=K1XJ89_9BACT|nr:MAG: hypothetical protein ACD_80C00098G0006 [uncultured bacterium (gcode 4)]
MTINLIYVFTILIGVYFGIKTYARTKNKVIIWCLGILLISLALELRWLNIGHYSTDITDAFWTTRDIIRTLLTIFLLRQIYMIRNQNQTEKEQIEIEKDQSQTEKEQNQTDEEQIERKKE